MTPTELARQFKEDFKKMYTYIDRRDLFANYLIKAKEIELDTVTSLFEGLNEFFLHNFKRSEELLSVEVEGAECLELKEYFLGMNMLLTNNLTKAVNYIKESLDRNPQSELLWRAMGYALMMRRKYKDAASCYRKAYKIAPNLGLALFELGFSLYKMGNSAESKKYMDKALELGAILEMHKKF